MPQRQFIRSRKAWYDIVNERNSDTEEFMLGFNFQDDEDFQASLNGEFGIRYHPQVSGWRVEAFDDSVLLLPHFADVLAVLGTKGTSFDGDALEALFVEHGLVDKTSRVAPEHIKGHPGLKP